MFRATRQSALHAARTLKIVWSASRGYTSAIAVFTLASAVLPLGVAWAGKGIVDAVVSARPTTPCAGSSSSSRSSRARR